MADGLPEENSRLRVMQRQLARACRGITDSSDQLDMRGVAIYRSLIQGSILRSLERAYPLARAILGEEVFGTLSRDFVATAPPRTPYFWQMPGHFIDYCRDHAGEVLQQYPFIVDLLTFEFAEIEINLMPDRPAPEVTLEGNVLEDPLVLNPELKLLELEYPVFLSVDRQALSSPRPCTLVGFRHPETRVPCFIELQGVGRAIVVALQRRVAPAVAILGNQDQVAAAAAEKAIVTLVAEGVLLGFAAMSG